MMWTLSYICSSRWKKSWQWFCSVDFDFLASVRSYHCCEATRLRSRLISVEYGPAWVSCVNTSLFQIFGCMYVYHRFCLDSKYSKSRLFPVRCRKATFSRAKMLRWLITVSSTFQEVDGSLLPLFITSCYNHGIKILLNYRWTRWYHFRDTIGYHSNTMTC